jgi:sugar phosphate isomerase/epimerase
MGSAGEPAFSISQITTLSQTFEDDLRVYADAGVGGIGVWEIKLPEGEDARLAEAVAAAGLASTNAVPAIPSILPLPLLPGPEEPAARIDAICASLHRLAPFRPSACVCLTGPASGLARERARKTVIDGLRTIADEAARAGVRVGLEPMNRIGAEQWTLITSLPDAVTLLEEVERPTVGILFDVWHLWNTPNLLAHIDAHAGRFFGVHVCDWREPTRGWADRVLPGDGVAGVPAILGALDRAGWDGHYDLEVFSDNGAFGNAYPDSLWDVPAPELARRGRDAFMACWGRRS